MTPVAVAMLPVPEDVIYNESESGTMIGLLVTGRPDALGGGDVKVFPIIWTIKGLLAALDPGVPIRRVDSLPRAEDSA